MYTLKSKDSKHPLFISADREYLTKEPNDTPVIFDSVNELAAAINSKIGFLRFGDLKPVFSFVESMFYRS